VQSVPRETRHRRSAVQRVSGERMPDGGEVDTQLVAHGHAGARFD
jgi:hypothetical protein